MSNLCFKVGDKLRLKRGRMKKKSSIQDKAIQHNRIIKANIGYQRSVVRYIGSNVPLKPSKRAYYQVKNSFSILSPLLLKHLTVTIF